MTCSGAPQTPGEILQFKVIAQKDGRLMAEGKFAIIGIAISTPEDLSTETPTASPTESPADLTPIPTMDITTPGFPTLTPPTSYPDYP